MWHGHADILIKHSKVKVVKHVPVDICENDVDEPPRKKFRTDSGGSTPDESDGSCTSVREIGPYMPLGPLKLQTGVYCKDLSHILAQTIVNSFIQSKKCPALEDHFIPCFLASESNITIHMYNPLYDILLTQGESMSLFSRGKLDIDTVFTVWLALNFDKFPAGLSNENVPETWQTYCGESSGFQNIISSCLDIYRNDLVEPIVTEESAVYKPNHRNAAVIILMKALWENEVKA